MAQPLLERNDASVVAAGKPGAITVDGGIGEPRKAVVNTVCESQVRLADAQDVPDIFVIKVHRNNEIRRYLALDSKVQAARKRCCKTGRQRERKRLPARAKKRVEVQKAVHC